ncbi:hypothetical protein AB0J39_38840, partial [Microbispora sp. NPDC049633]
GERLTPELRRITAAGLVHQRHEVRGVGLLIGIEFADPATAIELFMALVAHDVVANVSLSSDHVVRLTPPATLGEPEIAFLLERFERAVALVAEQNPEYEVHADA